MELIRARSYYFITIVHYKLELWSLYVRVLSLIEVIVTDFVLFFVALVLMVLISALFLHSCTILSSHLFKSAFSAFIKATYCTLDMHWS